MYSSLKQIKLLQITPKTTIPTITNWINRNYITNELIGRCLSCKPVISISTTIPTATTITTKKYPIINRNNCQHIKSLTSLASVTNTNLNQTNTTTGASSAAATATNKKALDEFMFMLPNLLNDLTRFIQKYDKEEAAEWFKRSILYNVPKGKRNRGLLTISSYRCLISEKLNGKQPPTDENIERVIYLGWCVEMLQAVFLIADDIMDHSETRRGQLCWYKVPDVGMIAINDSLMIENAMYYVLKEQFGHQNYYIELIELFHEAMMVTTIGESLDLQTASKKVDDFTMNLYNSIVENKTSFYSFYLPVAAAMLMAGHKNVEMFQICKEILFEIGFYFQVQDDYLDCFGDPNITGKIGTDIQDNKCSWLAVLCMEFGNSEQKDLMRECYGINDDEMIKRVKQLYIEIDLPEMYAKYENDAYQIIKKKIQLLPNGIPHELFYQIMEKIFRRIH